MNKHHKMSFLHLFHIWQNYVCFGDFLGKTTLHFVMLIIIKSMHLFNLHFWTYLCLIKGTYNQQDFYVRNWKTQEININSHKLNMSPWVRLLQKMLLLYSVADTP